MHLAEQEGAGSATTRIGQGTGHDRRHSACQARGTRPEQSQRPLLLAGHLGGLETAPVRWEIGGYDQWYQTLERVGGVTIWCCCAPDGTVAGLSEAGWDARTPGIIRQQLTAVGAATARSRSRPRPESGDAASSSRAASGISGDRDEQRRGQRPDPLDQRPSVSRSLGAMWTTRWRERRWVAGSCRHEFGMNRVRAATGSKEAEPCPRDGRSRQRHGSPI